MFLGVYWNHPVCPSVCLSVCVQNTSFCQSTGRGIKSHLVTVLDSLVISEDTYLKCEIVVDYCIFC